jgi:hypothetical protein
LKVAAVSFLSILTLGIVGIGLIVSPGVVASELDQPALIGAVLSHPRIHLLSGANSDVERGLVDPGVLKILLILAEEHELTRVGPIISGHSYYVRGTTRPSNHAFGRAVDILWVDGAPVSYSNAGALVATKTLLSLPEPLRPDEVGSPWRFPVRGSFSDADHLGHIHAGYSKKDNS